MYNPITQSLSRNLDLSRDEFNSSDKVEVPTHMFQFMLQLLLAGGSFNEEGYLRSNPDVAEAVKRGQIPSARLHYIGYGSLRGRGAMPEVDEVWYRKNVFRR